MSGFGSLRPALQYQIVNTLGWNGLRPVQELTIDAVLAGHNCVVLAPTAGGKTEASFFPVLSLMDEHDWRPVSVLYLSPIRALLNNQEDRVARLAGLLGRRAFKWHGDVTPGPRKAFLRDPADILLTTPESLEAMMMSARVPVRQLFAGLQAVIIDEVHAFADDDRGAHLSAVLERLTRFCGRDVQRIGLSATVGNPQEILAWIAGSSEREGVVVDPPKPRVEPAITLDHVGSASNAAVVIKRLHPGRKRLVFVDSRRGVEELGRFLLQSGVTTYVTHGSLSVSARRDAERAFETGSDCVIAATSALELGIDVGDLDHVLQLDSPPSVASFLQRMGRTGRRPGTMPNCTFLGIKDGRTLQAAAIIRLARRGFVEPVRPRRRAYHIFAHQVMALAIQHGGVPRDVLWAWLRGASAFAEIETSEREAIVAHMLEQGILSDQEGRLWLGPRGERLYGKRNFGELYAVFSTPRLITVRSDGRDIGTVDAQFLMGFDEHDQMPAFTLAGKPWRILSIDWPRAVCAVVPAEHARNTRWSGAPQYLERALCREMHAILIGDDDDPAWSKRAVEVIRSLRDTHRFLREAASPMTLEGEAITWWNYAGGQANLLLGAMLEAELGGKAVVRNESLKLEGDAGKCVVAVRQVLERWREEGRPTEDDCVRFAGHGARARVSKFEPCLPEEVLARLMAGVVVDREGAREAVALCVDG